MFMKTVVVLSLASLSTLQASAASIRYARSVEWPWAHNNPLGVCQSPCSDPNILSESCENDGACACSESAAGVIQHCVDCIVSNRDAIPNSATAVHALPALIDDYKAYCTARGFDPTVTFPCSTKTAMPVTSSTSTHVVTTACSSTGPVDTATTTTPWISHAATTTTSPTSNAATTTTSTSSTSTGPVDTATTTATSTSNCTATTTSTTPTTSPTETGPALTDTPETTEPCHCIASTTATTPGTTSTSPY